MVQLSLPYITTGKTIALTIQTFAGKVRSLLSKMLLRFVIAFLPRSRRLLISWLLSPSAVIMEPKKAKSVTTSISSPSICQEVMGPVVKARGGERRRGRQRMRWLDSVTEATNMNLTELWEAVEDRRALVHGVGHD